MKYSIWALVSTAPEWIEWFRMGDAETIEKAREIGKKCGWQYWRVRLTSESVPNYVVDGWDDGKWIE